MTSQASGKKAIRFGRRSRISKTSPDGDVDTALICLLKPMVWMLLVRIKRPFFALGERIPRKRSAKVSAFATVAPSHPGDRNFTSLTATKLAVGRAVKQTFGGLTWA